MPLRRPSWGGCLLVLLGGSVFAQTPTSTTATEIVITDRVLREVNTPAPALRLSDTELRWRAGTTLGETLQGQPGVSSTYFGPSSSRPTLRGLGGDRAPVLSNGAGAQDVSALSDDHALPFDPLSLERIEVLRGPAALRWGGPAVAGVINVIDNRIPKDRFEPEGQTQGRVEAAYGSGNREKSSSAMLESGNDRWVMHVDAFRRWNQDVSVPLDLSCDRPGAPALARRICNSSGGAQGGSVGASWFGDRSRWGASISEHSSYYGLPDFGSHGAGSGPAAHESSLRMRQQRMGLQGAWQSPMAGVRSLDWQWTYSHYRHREYENALPLTEIASQGHEARAELRHQPLSTPFGTWEGTVGLHSSLTRFGIDVLDPAELDVLSPRSTTRSQALFAVEHLPRPWGQWTLGIRSEQVSVQSLGHPLVVFETGERRFSPWSASAGWSAAVSGGWQWTGHVARVQRAPRDFELFANGPHHAVGSYDRGNVSLGVEQSWQWDTGLSWKRDGHQASATVFQHRYDNFIGLNIDQAALAADPTAELTPYRYEAIRARLQGIELQSSWRLSAGWTLSWKADALEGTDLDHQQPLPRLSPWRTGVGVQRQLGLLQLGVRWDHVGAQNRVPYPDRESTGSYNLLGAHAVWRTRWQGQQLMWFARADNLGNVLAFPATSILTSTARGQMPLPGRHVRLGVQWSF